MAENKQHSTPSELLTRWQSGDREALEELIPLVYKELRDIARYHLQRERPGHTLQSAALVNEAYLRMVEQRPFDTNSREHFFAVASRLMRQILVDYARTHGALKRGADNRVQLDLSLVLAKVPSADVITVDDALTNLAKLDEQAKPDCRAAFLWRIEDRGNRGIAERFSLDREAGLERSQGMVDQVHQEGKPWKRQGSGRKLRKSSLTRWNASAMPAAPIWMRFAPKTWRCA